MQFMTDKLSFNINEAKLIYSTEKRNRYVLGYYMGKTKSDFYITKNKRFFEVISNWDGHDIYFFKKDSKIPEIDAYHRDLEDMCLVLQMKTPLNIQKQFAKEFLKEA